MKEKSVCHYGVILGTIGAFLSLFFIRDSLLKFKSGAIHLEFMQDDYLDTY